MERSRHTVCLHSHLKKSVVPGKELLGCIRDPHPSSFPIPGHTPPSARWSAYKGLKECILRVLLQGWDLILLLENWGSSILSFGPSHRSCRQSPLGTCPVISDRPAGAVPWALTDTPEAGAPKSVLTVGA